MLGSSGPRSPYDPSPARAVWRSLTCLALILVCTQPAVGDWLVTRSGERIETAGPWEVKGRLVVYTDERGTLKSVRLTEIDIEASKAASVAVPAATRPRIIMYSTSWCRYCRQARQLLTELEADFVEKDIEKSAEAAQEYRAKADEKTGVPLFDIDGTLMRGYDAVLLRRAVLQIQGKELGLAQGMSLGLMSNYYYRRSIRRSRN